MSEEGRKRHRREIVLHGFQVNVVCIDRADNTNVNSYNLYYEAETKEQVMRYLMKRKIYPLWLDNLEDTHEVKQDLENVDNLTDDAVRLLFDRVYGDEFQRPDDDMHDTYYVSVVPWESPRFKTVPLN